MQDPPEIDDVIIKMESNLPVCRVCLNLAMEYIESTSTLCIVDGLKITYSDGFDLLAPNLIDFRGRLPNTFCASCGGSLLNAYLFRKRVENANIILKKINGVMEENIEKLDSAYMGDRRSDVEDNGDENQRKTKEELLSDCEDTFVDMCEEETLPIQPKIRQRRKIKKSTQIDENWPASPKDSLYTNSDSASSQENPLDEVELVKEKTSKFIEPSIWICNECGIICMSQKMLRQHEKYHKIAEKGGTKCKQCDKMIDSIEEHESHMCFHKFSELTSARSGKLTYRCRLCERKYRSEGDFTDHMNIHKDKKPHDCKYCSEIFHTKHLLQLHILRLHRNLQRNTIKTSKRTNVEKKEKCPHCCKMVRKSFMEIHKEVHFGPQNSTCPQCGKKFGSRLALKTHSLIHKQRGEFPCHICNKICLTMYALKSHIQFKHLMDKKEAPKNKPQCQCEDCGMVFQYPSKLRVHQRKHTAETPYKCPHCNRSYMRKDQFTIHMRYHSNNLPYKCDRCDKSYATKNNLSEHTKSVHDNVTYVCDECDQKFKSVTGLRKHKFLHTGYPYVCPICGLGQPFRSGIKAHLLRVHKDTFTEEEFEVKFPVVIAKSGFRRPKI